jgi:hypothetical protein
MGKSLAQFPTLPHLDTSEFDDGGVVDRAKEQKEFDRLYARIKKNKRQKNVLEELIRVGAYWHD